MRSLFPCVLAICVMSLPAPLTPQNRLSGNRRATRSEVVARNGMACTSQPLATQAAIDVLKQGGTAVDAAIAANAVLALTEPTGCGLGGFADGVERPAGPGGGNGSMERFLGAVA